MTVDKRLEDAADLELLGVSPQPANEAEVHHLVDLRVDVVDQPGIVAGLGQEESHHLDDLVAAEHQARVGAGRVELGETLAQERQQHADVERQRAPRDQAGHLDGVVGVDRAGPQEGVALALVDLDLKAQHGDVVAHRSAQFQHRVPELLVRVPVQRRP